jgi:hypothetical protein
MRTVQLQLKLSACAAAVVLLLSACGGGDLTTDKTPPTATIAAAASGNNVSFSFTFTEDVGTSFTAEDVTITGGTAGALTKVDATHYTLIVIPNGTTAVTATVAAAKFSDLANNPNTASASATFTPTAPPTAFSGIDFSGATTALEAFEGLVSATIESDPKDAANKAAKFVKGPAGQPWAGATVFTVAADKSVGAIDFSGSKIVTMRVYSPAPGKKIMLKFENAADAGKNMEVEATSLTTKTNDWETLSFDVASKFNAAVTYNKISVFPNFLVAETANTTYYFDDISFKTTTSSGTGTTTPPVASGLMALTNGIYASNYSEKPTPWQSVEGGTAGRYVDDSVAPADWWSGLAATDATPSFYFGYGLPAAPTKAWGFGAFVKAPKNGFADVSSYKNLVISVWGNDELVSTKPKFTVILKGAPVNTPACTPELKGEIAVAAAGVQTYTVALANLALQTACGFTTVTQALAGGVGEVHVQVLGANVQYVKTTDAGGKYPNGLNMGPIKFN